MVFWVITVVVVLLAIAYFYGNPTCPICGDIRPCNCDNGRLA